MHNNGSPHPRDTLGLDALIAAAKHVEVKPFVAKREVQRFMLALDETPPKARSSWWSLPWALTTVATGAAATLVTYVAVAPRVGPGLAPTVVVTAPAPATLAPVPIVAEATPATAPALMQLADHALLAQAAGARLQVLRSSNKQATLRLHQGEVAVKVGAPGLELAVENGRGELTRIAAANATVTVRTTSEGKLDVSVVRGQARVRTSTRNQVVVASASHAAETKVSHQEWVAALEAAPMLAPAPPPAPPPAGPVATEVAPAPPSPGEMWQAARLFRAQGEFRKSLETATKIVATGDTQWAPLAQLEIVRLQLGPLHAPEQAIASANAWLGKWPTHTLRGEAVTLRCAALRQLGREAECATP